MLTVTQALFAITRNTVFLLDLAQFPSAYKLKATRYHFIDYKINK